MALVVIINPVSGGDGRDRGRERATQAAAMLASVGQTADILVTDRRGHARELAAAAVARGASLVCSWGGDGTMNEVASVLVHTPTALALIPSGSGNGLARTLNVSLDPARALSEAVQAWSHGAVRTIDAGGCGDDRFFSVAGVGFDAHVAAEFDRRGKQRRGLSTYVRVALTELWRYEARRYRIDGVPLSRPALLVTVANAAQFGNGAWIAPQASVDDGRLDLVVVEERSRLASVSSVPRLFNGTLAQARGVTMRPLTQVVIEQVVMEADGNSRAADRAMPYHLDGEPKVGQGRLEFRVDPRALRICVR